MAQVGIRELKAQLSTYVKMASGGEPVVITDRGAVVAQIVPADGEAILQRLIDEGVATPPAHSVRRTPHPRNIGATISDLVSEQRE